MAIDRCMMVPDRPLIGNPTRQQEVTVGDVDVTPLQRETDRNREMQFFRRKHQNTCTLQLEDEGPYQTRVVRTNRHQTELALSRQTLGGQDVRLAIPQ